MLQGEGDVRGPVRCRDNKSSGSAPLIVSVPEVPEEIGVRSAPHTSPCPSLGRGRRLWRVAARHAEDCVW